MVVSVVLSKLRLVQYRVRLSLPDKIEVCVARYSPGCRTWFVFVSTSTQGITRPMRLVW